MQVTKREGYAIKNENEISLRAEASSQQETSAAQTQELAQSPNQTKAASDLANGRKFDDRFQANLLKNHLSGLEKNATKFAGENVGVIKDNLGKDIKRHDGPGVKDMFKMGRKQGLGGGNPLADQPSIDRGKKLPDMPYRRNDPSLVSSGTVTRVCVTKLTGEDPKPGGGTKLTGEDPKRVCVTKLTGEDPKPSDGTKKYVDSDPTGYGGGTGGEIEKPTERPPDAHDRLGHKIDAGNTLVPEYDAKTAVQAHKDRDESLIHRDPDSLPIEMTFDPSNPPRFEADELKNTGNPLDHNNDPKPAPWPKAGSGGKNPNTDGEGQSGVGGGDKPRG
jgi:hypothetical protein